MATNFDKLAQKWRTMPMLLRLVTVNVVLFLLLRIIGAVAMISGHPGWLNAAFGLLRLPSSILSLATHPWTIVTYMFVQYDVLHLMLNMLWLYWFGMVFVQFATQRSLVALYLFGGLVGALSYIVVANLPLIGFASAGLMGSSAAVIAVTVATAVMAPDYKLNLLFFGEVSLKWVALIMIGIDVIGFSAGNMGGHVSHVGGAVAGFIYGWYSRRGIDFLAGFNRLIDRLANLSRNLRRRTAAPSRPGFSSARTHSSSQTPSSSKASSDTARLDDILDKIRRSGYASLTPEERNTLFSISSNLKKQQ